MERVRGGGEEGRKSFRADSVTHSLSDQLISICGLVTSNVISAKMHRNGYSWKKGFN